ncbi:MAG: PEPxxWA-CTERM sorting domain-containing protein [Proteobacteria bacterium]|nr:PEPxxWA-CTERM sorting domain-containing protein [Pseudomonadota bacterium]
MHLKTIFAAGAAAAAIAMAGGASAAVVTFDSFRSATTIPAYGSHYSEAGLSFYVQSEGGADEEIGSFGYDGVSAPYDADPTGAAIFVNASSAKITITKTGGGTFDFDSIDLTDANNGQTPRSSYALNYSYVDGGGSHTGVFNLDSLPGLQTFAVGLTDVTSFTMFTGNTNANLGPGVQLDNVRFDSALDAVPEPISWALMICGFGLAGATLRYRRGVTFA